MIGACDLGLSTGVEKSSIKQNILWPSIFIHHHGIYCLIFLHYIKIIFIYFSLADGERL